MDADDDDGGEKGGHGNTKIPFGLCQREGIDIQKGWTPADAWKALEGKGYSAGETYTELKKTGKVAKKSGSKTIDLRSKSFAECSDEYDNLRKQWKIEESNREKKTREAEEKLRLVDTLNKIKENGDYHGESLQEVKKLEQDAWENEKDRRNYYKYRAIKDVMEALGEDAFSKDPQKLKAEMEAVVKKTKEPISYKEQNETREAYITAMAEKAKEAYPKLTDCDSANALESRVRADDFFKIGEVTRVTMNYEGMHEDHIQGVAKGLELMKKKFPNLKGLLPPPEMEVTTGGSYASTQNFDSKHPRVLLSKYSFSGPSMTQSLKSDVRSGFHAKGTGTVQATVVHEYGHVLDGLLTNRFKEDTGGKYFSAYVLDRIAKNHRGTPKADIMKSVSEYCVNNDADEGIEFLAEAFAEYCCSSKPRPIAVEVGTIMKEFISRL